MRSKEGVPRQVWQPIVANRISDAVRMCPIGCPKQHTEARIQQESRPEWTSLILMPRLVPCPDLTCAPLGLTYEPCRGRAVYDSVPGSSS